MDIAPAMEAASQDIKQPLIAHFLKADPSYGQGVAERLGLEAPASVAAM